MCGLRCGCEAGLTKEGLSPRVSSCGREGQATTGKKRGPSREQTPTAPGTPQSRQQQHEGYVYVFVMQGHR